MAGRGKAIGSGAAKKATSRARPRLETNEEGKRKVQKFSLFRGQSSPEKSMRERNL
uniref:Uncharacterized protein n=1 Tax=Zea mays TaxID=4577 RepID=B6UFF8_MAIZE|nr:hypothetical protein [Zea mays]